MVPDQLHSPDNARVGFSLKNFGRLLIHPYHFLGRQQPHPVLVEWIFGDLCHENLFLAHQNQRYRFVGRLEEFEGPPDQLGRGIVPTHYVQGYAHRICLYQDCSGEMTGRPR